MACGPCNSRNDEEDANADVIISNALQGGQQPVTADFPAVGRVDAEQVCEKARDADYPPEPAPCSLEKVGSRSEDCRDEHCEGALRLPVGALAGGHAPQSRALPDIRGLVPSGFCDAGAGPVETQATTLLKGLRACEAAVLLESSSASAGGKSEESSSLRALLEMQLRTLGDALETLGDHPGLSSLVAERDAHPEVLMGIRVPSSPGSARSAKSATSSRSAGACKRDVLEIKFDLDDEGRWVEAVVEFFPDGTALLMWTAFDLPVPLPYVLCMVHEVDLLGDIAPFVKDAGVLHQFSSNEADRLVRVISQPPIPMVSGLEAVAQRFGYDLLDTPWEAFCLVEVGPEWSSGNDASPSPPPAQKGPAKPATAEQWRGVDRPPIYQKGLKQVDVKKVVALGCPAGPTGECTTIIFSGRGDLKVPRMLLSNWLISWLVKLIGKFIYGRARDRVAKFDSSAHGDRLRSSSFYPELYRRIEEHVAAKVKRDTNC